MMTLMKPPAPENKPRRKTRIKIRSRFDRAGGAVDGEFVYDPETKMVTVREKGQQAAYSMHMAELAEYICRRNMGFAK